jgi:hypothetical protein
VRRAIDRHRDPKGAARSYAVFDADNTIWNHDLEEALLPFFETRGTLSAATLIRR